MYIIKKQFYTIFEKHLINITPKTRETRIIKLNKKILIDLHNEKILNQNVKCEKNVNIDQHDSNEEHKKKLKTKNIYMFIEKIIIFILHIISYIITIMIIFKVK